MMPVPAKALAQTDAYLLAASVLDSFDPGLIEPFVFDPSQSRDYDALLAKAVLTQLGPTAFEWRLSDDTRKAGLRVLAKQDRLRQALEANPGHPRNIYQDVFEQYIRGAAPPLDMQSLDQLQASLQAVRLLSDVVPELPDERAITALVRKQTFLQQFRLLADYHFCGRIKELSRLEAFVDALPVSGLRRLRRTVLSFVSEQLGMDSFVRTPPLLIQGPGGIGKSSLLAKFLIAHADRGTQDSLVFAYVDFDRGGIWPDEPLTVLADLAGQFASQAGSHGDELLQLQNHINESLCRSEDYSVEYDSSESLGSGSVAQHRQQHYLKQFVELSEHAFSHGKRTTMLLVFDSFEEVTHRGESHVLTLFRFLNELQSAMPRLRTVLSGRGSLRLQVDHHKLELRPVDPETTLAILQSYEIADPAILECIIERVGGHPLSIRLAAQLVVMSQRDAGLNRAADGWQELFRSKLEARLDEGVLFRRIVDHIDDAEVRKLISPGFVLRLVTPELILYVLKEPCALTVSSLDEARALFSRLAQYNSLVSQRSNWQLKHRADVRGLILEGLRRTRPELCQQIWRSAVAYYSDKTSVMHRAEEMYCRLMLREAPHAMNQRWLSGIEKLLSNSQDELPRESADFLQYKMLSRGSGANVAPQFSGDAQSMREAEEMKYLLSRGNAKAALDVPTRLSKPGDNPVEPLYALTARAYAQLGEFDSAFQMAHQGLKVLDGGFQTEASNYLDLLLLAAQMSLEWRRSGMDAQQHSRASPAIPEEQLWRWCVAVPHGRATRYRRLRVTVYVLELIRLDKGGGRPYGAPGNLEAQCVANALRLLRKIASFEGEINGLFVLRMYGLLAADQPARTELRLLLALDPVLATLADGFAKNLGKRIEEAGAQLQVFDSKASLLLAYLTSDVIAPVRRLTLESDKFSDLDFQLLAHAVALEFARRDGSRRASPALF